MARNASDRLVDRRRRDPDELLTDPPLSWLVCLVVWFTAASLGWLFCWWVLWLLGAV